MTVKLYNFVKKHNSTAQPPETSGVETNVVLKEHTSINTPIFKLKIAGIPQYNYLYWPDMHQYYYISDIVSINNEVWELHCECDVLATAKSYILATDAFVKYSTINFDEYLKDDRIIPTTEIVSTSSNNLFGEIADHPEYTSSYSLLLTVLNGDPNSNEAGIKHYLINATILRYICERLVQDGDTIIGGARQIFADAKDSLIKLQLIPWSLSGLQSQDIIGDNPVPIFLGDYDTGQTGYIMDANATFRVDDFVSIPSRPNNFTRIEPYCEAKIHIPLIGTHDLSLAELSDVSNVKFRYICNIGTGKATCIIWKGDADIQASDVQILGSFDGSVNADVPLGYATSQNPFGILTGVASAAAAVASSGALTVGGIAGAVASFASYFTKQASIINAFGGNTSAFDSHKLSIYMIKHGLSEEPDNLTQLYGRPCGKVLNMNTLLNGYVETSQFELAAPYDDVIIQKVNNLMNSGIYLQ